MMASSSSTVDAANETSTADSTSILSISVSASIIPPPSADGSTSTNMSDDTNPLGKKRKAEDALLTIGDPNALGKKKPSIGTKKGMIISKALSEQGTNENVDLEAVDKDLNGEGTNHGSGTSNDTSLTVKPTSIDATSTVAFAYNMKPSSQAKSTARSSQVMTGFSNVNKPAHHTTAYNINAPTRKWGNPTAPSIPKPPVPKKPPTQLKVVTDTKNMTVEEKAKHDKEVEEIRKECAEKQKVIQLLYQRCKKEINLMTEENLPRKSKRNGKVKVSVTVPATKKGGDKVTFINPHVPGQKLLVTVPLSVKAGQIFKVSVPMPTVARTVEPQNKFTKSCVFALSDYSTAYDDWCQSEAIHRGLVPKFNPKDGKVIPFKIGVERLKKFDTMMKEFPQDLEAKVDPILLRLLVRRLKQNEQKKLKTIANIVPLASASTLNPPSADTTTPKKQVMMNIQVPVKSNKFSSIKFRADDFEVMD